jgi:hypothetical protein
MTGIQKVSWAIIIYNRTETRLDVNLSYYHQFFFFSGSTPYHNMLGYIVRLGLNLVSLVYCIGFIGAKKSSSDYI